MTTARSAINLEMCENSEELLEEIQACQYLVIINPLCSKLMKAIYERIQNEMFD